MERFKASQAKELVKKNKVLQHMPKIYDKIKIVSNQGSSSIRFLPHELSREHIDILLEDGYTVITNREEGDYHRSGSVVDYVVSWS